MYWRTSYTFYTFSTHWHLRGYSLPPLHESHRYRRSGLRLEGLDLPESPPSVATVCQPLAYHWPAYQLSSFRLTFAQHLRSILNHLELVWADVQWHCFQIHDSLANCVKLMRTLFHRSAHTACKFHWSTGKQAITVFHGRPTKYHSKPCKDSRNQQQFLRASAMLKHVIQ